MIVVSGCPRSGTSLMMDLFRVAVGDDRIVGSKFPREVEVDDRQSEAVEYLRSKNPERVTSDKRSREMNPNGFWECPWSVRGIQYEQDKPDAGKVCKIVSQGLARSNPEYIDKLVLMVRHPWQVANSHRNLKVGIPVSGDVRNADLGNISPDAYNKVTYAACKWIVKNKPDMIAVNYDDLIVRPSETLYRVSQFIGEGSWQEAAKRVDPELKRSQPSQVNDHPSWSLSLKVHEKFVAGDYQGVIDVVDAEPKPAGTKNVRFMCPRWGGVVSSAMCQNCQGDETARGNMIKTANRRRVAWWDEPCLWECGMNPADDYTPLTVEQSIERNHWVQPGMGSWIHRLGKLLHKKPCNGCASRSRKLDARVQGAKDRLAEGLSRRLKRARQVHGEQ